MILYYHACHLCHKLTACVHLNFLEFLAKLKKNEEKLLSVQFIILVYLLETKKKKMT